ncbi:sensor histidine kinase [Paenibacillus antibioticophila]|uniref:sensor histidine kinase n=1 Tax=Paenibacillus antibioticophila TaxID=1274374 RepID=UPI0005C9AAEF|nr:histidine kinase [Paenibacillus antibioticophila]
MKHFYYTGFPNSILFKILAVFTILIPLIVLFIYNNYQSRSTLVEQIKSTHLNMMESYWIQIDNQLKNAASFAITTAFFENDPQLALSKSEPKSMLAKQRISLKLSEQIINYNNIIDTLFVYTDNDFISANKTSLKSEERDAIKSLVLETAHSLEMDRLNANWNLVKIDGHSSMLYISKGDNAVLTGVYINLDRLVGQYAPKDESASLLLLSNDDVASSNFIHPKNSLIVTASSSAAPISFVEIIQLKTIMETFPFMQKYILAISVMVALLLPFIFLLLRQIVVQPLQQLNKAMKHIQRGDLQYRIPPYRVSNEIAIVNQTFNQMMDEVQYLKISVYEEELKAQKSQLRNLQLQVRPHFIINSLNMVYNLLENGDSQTARRLIIHSVDFYRYMTKVDIDLVPLYEEIKHVKTYLQIQSIRYNNKFTYSINTNKMVEDMLVPPMLIQNFVENSIKYAIQADRCIHISIKVDTFEIDFYPFAKIIISDTGNGYPTHLLDRLNHGQIIEDQNGEHIGIRNSVQRLSLLFEEKARWHFYNNNGAVSELILPALFSDHSEVMPEDEE